MKTFRFYTDGGVYYIEVESFNFLSAKEEVKQIDPIFFSINKNFTYKII